MGDRFESEGGFLGSAPQAQMTYDQPAAAHDTSTS
jgi:hypothetical protein